MAKSILAAGDKDAMFRIDRPTTSGWRRVWERRYTMVPSYTLEITPSSLLNESRERNVRLANSLHDVVVSCELAQLSDIRFRETAEQLSTQFRLYDRELLDMNKSKVLFGDIFARRKKKLEKLEEIGTALETVLRDYEDEVLLVSSSYDVDNELEPNSMQSISSTRSHQPPEFSHWDNEPRALHFRRSSGVWESRNPRILFEHGTPFESPEDNQIISQVEKPNVEQEKYRRDNQVENMPALESLWGGYEMDEPTEQDDRFIELPRIEIDDTWTFPETFTSVKPDQKRLDDRFGFERSNLTKQSFLEVPKIWPFQLERPLEHTLGENQQNYTEVEDKKHDDSETWKPLWSVPDSEMDQEKMRESTSLKDVDSSVYDLLNSYNPVRSEISNTPEFSNTGTCATPALGIVKPCTQAEKQLEKLNGEVKTGVCHKYQHGNQLEIENLLSKALAKLLAKPIYVFLVLVGGINEMFLHWKIWVHERLVNWQGNCCLPDGIVCIEWICVGILPLFNHFDTYPSLSTVAINRMNI